MSRNDENLHQRSIYDGFGDNGTQFRIRATALVERGWDATEIAEDVKAQPWKFAIPPDWDNKRLQQEIESCGAACAPKPAAKAAPISVWDDGLPGWLRERIESLEAPVDSDQYFHDIVAALACRGWDRKRIVIEIAGRPWVPKRYAASHALEWRVQVLLMAVPLRITDDVAAWDLRAVQRAIASGRWRESVQAKAWAGHAVAAVMKLDTETDKAKIVALLKTWIESGALVVVEGEDEQRKRRQFVEVGSVTVAE